VLDFQCSFNAGGMTSAQLVGHETLEGYDEAKGNTKERQSMSKSKRGM